MYNPPSIIGTGGVAGGVGVGGVVGGAGGALAYTGFNTVGYVVAAATLVFLGMALLRLVPRRES